MADPEEVVQPLEEPADVSWIDVQSVRESGDKHEEG